MATRKKNGSAKRRRRQMTIVANPIAPGAYEKVWKNPVTAGAFEDAWGDIVQPVKRSTRKPVVTVKSARPVAKAKPSAAKSKYKKVPKVAGISLLTGPFTIDSDDQANKAVYFIDGKGKGYVYKYKNSVGRMSALKRLAVAETTSAKPTKAEKTAIKALEKEFNDQSPVAGTLIVVEEVKAKPARKKPARKPARKPVSKQTQEERDIAAIEAAFGLSTPVAKKKPAKRRKVTKKPAGNTAAQAKAAAMAKMKAALGISANRRNIRRNTAFPPAVKAVLIKGIKNQTGCTTAEAKGTFDLIAEVFSDNKSSVEKAIAKIKKATPTLLQAYRDMVGSTDEVDDKPTAEEIAATIQGVSISGDEETAEAMVDGADSKTLKAVYKMLISKTKIPTPSVARKKLKAVIAEQYNAFQDQSVEDVPAPKTKAPSDKEARAVIEALIIEKVAELRSGKKAGKVKPARKPAKKPTKPTTKVSAQDLADAMDSELDDIFGNPRRNRRKARRKTVRRLR